MVTVEYNNADALITKNTPLNKNLYNIGGLTGFWLFSHVEFESNIQQAWKATAIATNVVWILTVGWIFLLFGYLGGCLV